MPTACRESGRSARTTRTAGSRRADRCTPLAERARGCRPAWLPLRGAGSRPSRPLPVLGPRHRRRTGTAVRWDGREPLGLGTAISMMTTEHGAPAAGGSVLARFNRHPRRGRARARRAHPSLDVRGGHRPPERRPRRARVRYETALDHAADRLGHQRESPRRARPLGARPAALVRRHAAPLPAAAVPGTADCGCRARENPGDGLSRLPQGLGHAPGGPADAGPGRPGPAAERTIRTGRAHGPARARGPRDGAARGTAA